MNKKVLTLSAVMVSMLFGLSCTLLILALV